MKSAGKEKSERPTGLINGFEMLWEQHVLTFSLEQCSIKESQSLNLRTQTGTCPFTPISFTCPLRSNHIICLLKLHVGKFSYHHLLTKCGIYAIHWASGRTSIKIKNLIWTFSLPSAINFLFNIAWQQACSPSAFCPHLGMERGNTAQWLEGGEPPILECFTYIRGKQHVGQIHVSFISYKLLSA